MLKQVIARSEIGSGQKVKIRFQDADNSYSKPVRIRNVKLALIPQLIDKKLLFPGEEYSERARKVKKKKGQDR